MLKKLRQNHFMKKSITILCIIVMLFCFIPVNVFATTIRQELQKEENAEVITEDNILELFRVALVLTQLNYTTHIACT